MKQFDFNNFKSFTSLVFASKGNTITLKGTNLFNRFSSVRLSDVVEGIILRKYYNVKPKVHITVTYFKVGGKVTHDSYNKKKEKVTYSLGASYTYTTSIKIKVKVIIRICKTETSFCRHDALSFPNFQESFYHTIFYLSTAFLYFF